MMLRFSKTLSLAGAVLALGMASTEARASFLVKVTATIDGQSSLAVNGASSSTTLVAMATSNPADLDISSSNNPVHTSFGSTTTTVSARASGLDSYAIPYEYTLSFQRVGTDGSMLGAATTIDVTGTVTGNVGKYGSTLANTYSTFNGVALMGVTPPSVIMIDGVPVSVMLDQWTPPGTPPTSVPNFSVAMIFGTGGSFTPVPEPGTIALLAIGGVGLLGAQLRRRKATAAEAVSA